MNLHSPHSKRHPAKSGSAPSRARAGGTVNAEVVNDRAKLIMHRIAARRLAREPQALLEAARRVLQEERERGPAYRYLDEWEQLLNVEPARLRSILTERSERMTWLRSTSPFGRVLGLTDPVLRRRIWRLARTGAELAPAPHTGRAA